MKTYITIETIGEPLKKWKGREKEVEERLREDLDIPTHNKIIVRFKS